ncbi:MAG: hypothetical protein H3C27_08560 [Opitutaceae bacterium]|nr:hypothetical protein [Opitutaceae bacterium]
MNNGHTEILSIAPGQVQPINLDGRNFFVVFAPVEIDIKLPGDEFVSYGQGTGMGDLPDGKVFKRLEVRNPSLGTILVKIYIGGPLYRDSRAAIIEPKTRGIGWAGVSIPATSGVTFTGITAGLLIRRKAIQVTNLDAALDLQLRDPDGNVILTIFPRTSITLPISEEIEVYNQNGSAVACNISETWWTL